MIPARDESKSLALVIAGVRKAAPDTEIVVVDSASTDSTADIARELGATVVSLSEAGYARALRAGYLHLLERGFTQVVQIDADGQHPADSIPALFAGLDETNWVIGSRAGTDSSGSLDRKLGNAILSLLVRVTTGLTINDVTSGFWALDKDALSGFAENFPQETADANVRVIGHKLGLTISELPVVMVYRRDGESMHDGLTGARNFAMSVAKVFMASAASRQR